MTKKKKQPTKSKTQIIELSSIKTELSSAIYAFIDSQNLNLAIRGQGWRLDFKKFRTYLQDKYNVEKAFLFIGYIPENQKLYIRLQDFGYIVIFKPTLKLPDGTVKGNVDAELVMHTMIELPNYNQAIIISNDGDFHCLIEHLEDNNKLKNVIIPDKNKYSQLLRRFRRHFVYMNHLRGKLAFKATKKRGSNLRTKP